VACHWMFSFLGSLQTEALGKVHGGSGGGYRRHMVKSTSLGLRVIDAVAFRRDQRMDAVGDVVWQQAMMMGG